MKNNYKYNLLIGSINTTTNNAVVKEIQILFNFGLINKNSNIYTFLHLPELKPQAFFNGTDFYYRSGQASSDLHFSFQNFH